MKGQETKELIAFRASKLKRGEKIFCHLSGWVSDMLGKKSRRQFNGQFIVTSDRVCFQGWRLFGEVFESIPATQITSVVTHSVLNYRVLGCHAVQNELVFKTFEPKSFFDAAYEAIELVRLSRSQPNSMVPTVENIADHIRKLSEFKNDGIISEAEFAEKKTELLKRL